MGPRFEGFFKFMFKIYMYSYILFLVDFDVSLKVINKMEFGFEAPKLLQNLS